MNERRVRQIGTVTGAFFVLVSAGVGGLLGAELLEMPVVLTQALLLGGSGVAYLLGSVEALPRGPLAWYRWNGIANILVGIAIPLGFANSEGSVSVVLVVVAIGGLSLAAMGLDMLVFHGYYTYGERLDG